MKLSERTKELLSNLSKINQSIVFHKGHVLRTIAEAENVSAKINIAEKFDDEFAVYDLKKFLAAISIFDNPEITIKDKYCEITQDKQKLIYVFCAPSLIKSPPNKDYPIDKELISFKLPIDQFKKTVKVLNVMTLSELAITANSGEVFLRCISVSNSTGDLYSLKVMDIEDKSISFDFHFKREVINLIYETEYTISINQVKNGNYLIKFSGSDIEYYLTCEITSKVK